MKFNSIGSKTVKVKIVSFYFLSLSLFLFWNTSVRNRSDVPRPLDKGRDEGGRIPVDTGMFDGNIGCLLSPSWYITEEELE